MRSVILLAGLALAHATPASSQGTPEQRLPVYGGSGGTAFARDCGPGMVLSGLRYRAGLFVDAVGLLCRSVHVRSGLGPETTVGTLVGGGGGTAGAGSCPSASVVTGAEIQYGAYVDRISLICRVWSPLQRRFMAGGFQKTNLIGNWASLATLVTSGCEDPSQPASGIRGRAHSLIDAIGFICDEP